MSKNQLVYDINDKPALGKNLVFAFQQVLAIMAATIAVPTIIGLPTQIPAAILGAGLGTIVYLLFTKFKSPVIISSSFAFLSSLSTALLRILRNHPRRYPCRSCVRCFGTHH